MTSDEIKASVKASLARRFPGTVAKFAVTTRDDGSLATLHVFSDDGAELYRVMGYNSATDVGAVICIARLVSPELGL